MLLDLKLVGSKLAGYRNQFQATREEVAARTGIAASRLADIEAGDTEPTGDEILVLADFYKCDYKFFISHERLAPYEQTEMLFRSISEELTRDDRWAVQELLFLCECEEYLQHELLGQVSRPFTFAKRGGHFKTHGEEAAASLRRHLGYEADEVPNVFVDIRRIGFHVFRRKLQSSEISGLYVRHPVAGQCVLVNYREDVYRQRFTAAHETGHAILDAEKDFVVSYTRRGKRGLSEIRANTFASHFLIPPSLLERIPNPEELTQTRLANLCQQLKVSPSALLIALKEAGVLSEEAAATLVETRLPREAKTDPELPPDLTPLQRTRRGEMLRRGLSSYYVDLCFEAYERGEVSAGRVAEMLLMDQLELADVAALFGRRLHYAE